MLVLARRPGESLLVGDDVEIRVIRIDGDRVVIGVVAPSDIRVVRTELLGDGASGSGAMGPASEADERP